MILRHPEVFMARRAGKAAARKSRQRRVQRPASRPGASQAPSVGAATASQAPAVSVPAAPDPQRSAAPAPATSTGLGSTLSVRERAEYHYVERDLRNIGILTAVMGALLLLAWVVFNATGLVA
jgi:hypothetical protein